MRFSFNKVFVPLAALVAVGLCVAGVAPAVAGPEDRDAGAKARGEFGRSDGSGAGQTDFGSAPRPESSQPAPQASTPTRRFSFEPMAVEPGDTIVVVSDRAKLMVGDRVVATLERGQELTVSKVEGGWIGAWIELEGTKRGGWVWMDHTATTEMAAGRQSEARRFSFEPGAEQQRASPPPARRSPSVPEAGRQGREPTAPEDRDAGAKARGEFGH
jgi:hypothetical protein